MSKGSHRMCEGSTKSALDVFCSGIPDAQLIRKKNIAQACVPASVRSRTLSMPRIARCSMLSATPSSGPLSCRRKYYSSPRRHVFGRTRKCRMRC